MMNTRNEHETTNTKRKDDGTMKQFNVNEHLSCPACGFETVVIDAAHKRIALARKDGTADHESWERDLDAKPSDVGGVYCNSRHCGVKIDDPTTGRVER